MNLSSSSIFIRRIALGLLGAALLGAVGVAAQRVAFVTSVTGDGVLAGWPDAGGAVGLAAGDAICQARATAAGLANPAGFVAWLSDSDDDAYCRLHGLTGKRSANCGQPTLPVGAGPWVRTDGYPFADRIDQMLSPIGRVYAPVRYDEFGAPSVAELYFTGTENIGAVHPSYPVPCADWTANGPGIVSIGSAEGTRDSWSNWGSTLCSSVRPLLCLETGAGTPLPPFWEAGAKFFVTSTRHEGDLGGLVGGDAICIARATAAGLPCPDCFRVWLSDDSTDARIRLSLGVPYNRVDGVKIAADASDLTDGQLLSSINVTELGDYLGDSAVWTGTLADGTGTVGETCLDWSTAAAGETGRWGWANRASSWWTDYLSLDCSQEFRLYCYTGAVFDVHYDGFESGDTAAWSTAVP